LVACCGQLCGQAGERCTKCLIRHTFGFLGGLGPERDSIKQIKDLARDCVTRVGAPHGEVRAATR
jgi:hypothetical protein